MSLINGKPLEKLIEVISQGVGKLYTPRAMRKEADAEAYKIEVVERAKIKAAAEGKLVELQLYETIQQRLIHQETNKQKSIDNIIEVAAEQIKLQETVSEEKVDPDWTTRFFNISEDISNDEMQKLWGRILAGEVKQPGTFSLRTLETLKNLTKEEAEVFSRFAQFKVKSTNTSFVPYKNESELEAFNIKYVDIFLLTELGLISSESTLGFFLKGSEEEQSQLYRIGEMGLNVITSPNIEGSYIRIIAFTKTGIELSSLISIENNPEYIKYVCNALTTAYTKIVVGTIAEFDDNQIKLLNPLEYKK